MVGRRKQPHRHDSCTHNPGRSSKKCAYNRRSTQPDHLVVGQILLPSSSAARRRYVDRSSTIPIMTNISTASSVSIDCPARTRSFIRLTMKDLHCGPSATSHPSGKELRPSYPRQIRISEDRYRVRSSHRSAIRAADILHRLPVSTACVDQDNRNCPKRRSSPKDMIRRTTDCERRRESPDRIPANRRQRKTMIMPISMPSSPNKHVSTVPNISVCLHSDKFGGFIANFVFIKILAVALWPLFPVRGKSG